MRRSNNERKIIKITITDKTMNTMECGLNDWCITVNVSTSTRTTEEVITASTAAMGILVIGVCVGLMLGAATRKIWDWISPRSDGATWFA